MSDHLKKGAIVSSLIQLAFQFSASEMPELHHTWIRVSFTIGGKLPDSLLAPTVQRLGELDMVLRSMENDASPSPDSALSDPYAMTHLAMFSEFWIGGVYEVLRLLEERKLAPKTDAFRQLADDFRLLRIPLEKHEIASQGQLSAPLEMQRGLGPNSIGEPYFYSKQDSKRAHISKRPVCTV